MPALSAEHYRALSLLAGMPDGLTVPAFMAHGFEVYIIADLVAEGLVTTTTEQTNISGHGIGTRARITEAGRRALAP